MPDTKSKQDQENKCLTVSLCEHSINNACIYFKETSEDDNCKFLYQRDSYYVCKCRDAQIESLNNRLKKITI